MGTIISAIIGAIIALILVFFRGAKSTGNGSPGVGGGQGQGAGSREADRGRAESGESGDAIRDGRREAEAGRREAGEFLDEFRGKPTAQKPGDSSYDPSPLDGSD